MFPKIIVQSLIFSSNFVIVSKQLTNSIKHGFLSSTKVVFQKCPTFIPKLKSMKPRLQILRVKSFMQSKERPASPSLRLNVLNITGVFYQQLLSQLSQLLGKNHNLFVVNKFFRMIYCTMGHKLFAIWNVRHPTIRKQNRILVNKPKIASCVA